MLLTAALLLLQTPLNVELETLADRQVVQRDAQNGADLRVEGTCADGLPQLGARVLRGRELVAWKLLEVRDLEGPRARFRASVRVPAGGWYTLELAAAEDQPALFTLQRFGVGEVFVIAGQSNSSNYGEERLAASSDRVSAFDGQRWSLAQDPMPGVQDQSSGGSCWPVFGGLLVQALDLPVGIASVGYGGTSLRHWQKGHQFGRRDGSVIVLYDGLQQRLASLGRVRAILWHQGESDAAGGMQQEEYERLFTALRDDLKAELDAGLPAWFMARVSFVPELAREKMDPIRAAQGALARRGLVLAGPDTDDLLGAMRHSKDRIHFSRRGLEAHGARWFALVFAWLDAGGKPPGS